ncbi:MAG: tropomyosin [Leptolyngbyaceae cyanobacterium]
MTTLTTDRQILQTLQRLEAEISNLKETAQHQVGVRVHRSSPLLGQEIPLTLSVVDSSGVPQPNVPVLITTSWGTLRVRNNILLTESGTALTLQSDAKGQVELTLSPTISETLLPQQQAAITAFLSLIDPGAATPRDTENSFREMAQLYRWQANHSYRQAVDIYFQDYGQRLLESVNAQDYLARWQYLDAVICAYVQPVPADGASSNPLQTLSPTSAAVQLRIKNWLGPWLEVLLDRTTQESTLDRDFGLITRAPQSEAVTESLYNRVETYVTDQLGMVGDYIGRKVAENTLTTFLNTELDDLEVNTKVALAQTLQTASKTLASGGTAALASLNRTRQDLKQTVVSELETGKLADLDNLSGQVGQITQDLAGIQTAVGRLDTDTSNRLMGVATQLQRLDSQLGDTNNRLQGRIREIATSVDERFDSFDSQVSRINTELIRLDNKAVVTPGQFEQLTGQVATLDDQVQAFDTRLLRSDRQQQTQLITLETQLQTVDTRLVDSTTVLQGLTTRLDENAAQLAGFNEQTASINERLDSTALQLQRVNSTLATNRSQVTAVVSRLDRTDRRFDDLDTRLSENSEQLKTTNQRLDRNDSRLEEFDSRFKDSDTRLERFDSRLGQTDRRFQEIDTRFDTNAEQLQTVESQLEGVTSRVNTLNTTVNRTNNTVTGLQRNVATVNTQISGLNNQVSDLSGNFTQLDNRFSAVDTKVGSLETNLNRVDNQFTVIDNRFNGLQTNMTRLTRATSGRIVRLEDSVSRVGNNVLSLRTDMQTDRGSQPGINRGR